MAVCVRNVGVTFIGAVSVNVPVVHAAWLPVVLGLKLSVRPHFYRIQHMWTAFHHDLRGLTVVDRLQY